LASAVRPDRISARKLARELALPLPGRAAQLTMAPEYRLPPAAADIPCEPGRAASVLVLLYPDAPGTSFPLIRRTDSPGPHGGQMALPGGALDGCESPERAALRETEEELGVEPSAIELLGALSPLPIVRSGFLVQPFVGWIDERPSFRPSPAEVAEIVETCLDELLDPANRRIGRREYDGRQWNVPYFSIKGHEVWGATAMILAEFAAIVSGIAL